MNPLLAALEAPVILVRQALAVLQNDEPSSKNAKLRIKNDEFCSNLLKFEQI